MEALGRAEAVEQRLQAPGELDGDGDVVAGVGPEALERRRVVVAVHARVQRHDQPVVGRHPGHLDQHVAAEARWPPRSSPRRAARRRRSARPPRSSSGQRHDVGVAVVGGDGAVLLEVAASLLERREVARRSRRCRHRRPRRGGRRARRSRAGPARGSGRAGRSGRRAAAKVGSAAQGAVVGEVVDRVVGRGEDLDAEAVHERPRAELRRGEPRGDLVVDRVGGLGARPLGDAEDVGEHAVHPEPARRAPEGRPVLAEQAPGPPRRLRRRAGARRRRGRRAATPGRAAAGRRSGPGEMSRRRRVGERRCRRRATAAARARAAR